MKYIPNAIKFGIQSRSSWLIINVIFEIADLDSKLNTWADLALKIAMCLIFMKFGTQNKLNMVIMNILIGIDDLDSKLQYCEIWCRN